MADFSVTYKNHCTPQEYITENSRWYLDSDVGARLTGTFKLTTATQPVYVASLEIIGSGGAQHNIATVKNFIYLKNTGDGDVVVSFSGNYPDAYRILLSSGECLATRMDTLANVWVKTSSATATTIEHLTAID